MKGNTGDFKRLEVLLRGAYNCYSKELITDGLNQWWRATKQNTIEEIEAALDWWVEYRRLPPTPADINEIILEFVRDGGVPWEKMKKKNENESK